MQRYGLRLKVGIQMERNGLLIANEIICRAPPYNGAPADRYSLSVNNNRLLRAFDDFAADEGVETGFMADVECLVRGVRGDKPHHADTHVEDAVRFGIVDVARFRDETENRRGILDRALVEHGVDVRRKYARNIVVKSAARDVRNAVEREIHIHRGFDRRPIAGVRLQKSFADRLMIQLGKFGVDFVAAAVEEHLTRKAEAVRVQAVRA